MPEEKRHQAIDEQRRTLLGGAAGALSLGAAWPLAGCGGGGGGGATAAPTPAPAPAPIDQSAPTLASISPGKDATAVALESSIVLTFSEDIKLAADAITLTNAAGKLACSVSVSGNTATLKPSIALQVDTAYTVNMTAGITDLAGNAFSASSSSFSTGSSKAALPLGAMIMDSFIKRYWSGADFPKWNALPTLQSNGIKIARGWVTTLSFPELRTTPRDQWHTLPWKNGYWSCLEVTGAMLRDAADAGLKLQAVLFLSDQAASAGGQPLATEWAGLSAVQLAEKVEAHAVNVAQYYKSLGLDIDVFEFGNETDFGLCGIELGKTVAVPAGVDPVNDPAWMRDNVYAKTAPLLKAAIRGVKSVYPASRALLHTAGFGYSKDDIAARGFFKSMIELGVPFEVAGYSYPYMFIGGAVPQPFFRQSSFIRSIDSTRALGKSVQIVEYNYPADPKGMISAPAAEFPFTDAGQAAFVTAMANALRGRLEALHYWYPDWYPGFDPSHPEHESCGLFTAPDVARPALAALKAIAQGN